MAYEHLYLEREAPVTERHKRRYVPPPPPNDLRAAGARLSERLRAATERMSDPGQSDIGGFDDRKLLKIILSEGALIPDLDAIPGMQVLSQENKQVVLAFASDDALAMVESRLATLAADGAVTRKELLYVLEDFDHWTPEDRTGPALKSQGFPDTETFMLDIELWPQTELTNLRAQLVDGFLQWLSEHEIERLDYVVQPSLVMMRVRCALDAAEQLLRHRDVRTVDLPPRTGLDVRVLSTDINAFPEVSQPADDAPAVAVLDSGITEGHPLLGAAVGDAQGYLPPHKDAHDSELWHGTFVAGLALYGDVEERIREGLFVPDLRLLSGKVFEEGNNNPRFVENAVDEAVRELHQQYGCKVFNLSYGDRNKVYDGRHLRGLAYTLDRLARELGVLFVVPAGNLLESELPDDANATFPEYLLEDSARLLDPATALNALTVGGLALHESNHYAQRYPNDIVRPIARARQPFPLGRSGTSINGAIKPDFVEYAGNTASVRGTGRLNHQRLGVVSLNGGFAGGTAFAEDIGTSFAAPVVAHRAARILAAEPNASANLLRALLGAHARWPAECTELLHFDNKAPSRAKLLRLIGYGRVDERALYRSLDDTVTLLAEEQLACDNHHFYEIPLPDSFRSSGKRQREITVALAYSPAVRTTRLDYVASKLKFEFVLAGSMEEVERSFTKGRKSKDSKELGGTRRWLSGSDRNHGTLQVSSWTFKQPPKPDQRLFVVITRNDSIWSPPSVKETLEPYALAVVVSDQEQENARLYAELKADLQARAQVRARARVRS